MSTNPQHVAAQVSKASFKSSEKDEKQPQARTNHEVKGDNKINSTQKTKKKSKNLEHAVMSNLTPSEIRKHALLDEIDTTIANFRIRMNYAKRLDAIIKTLAASSTSTST